MRRQTPSVQALAGSCLLLLTVLHLAGCASTEPAVSEPAVPAALYDIEIRLKGTSGLRFNGQYTIEPSRDISNKKFFPGTVPAEYKLQAARVTFDFQKLYETGELSIEIFVNGQPQTSGSTTKPFGAISGEIKDGLASLQFR